MASRAAYVQAHWLTSRIAAWAGFDVMSSVYIGIVPNVFFPIYFQRFVAGSGNAAAAWGLLAAVAIFVSGLTALGAATLARYVSRFRLIFACIAALIAFLLLLSLDLPASVWTVSLLYVAAQSSYFAATTNYESYLPDIVPPGSVGRVSGFGWAIGYLGGVAGAAILLATLGHSVEDARLYRMTFAAVALLTACFAAPVFVAMARMGFSRLGPPLTEPNWTGILDIVRRWRDHRPVFVLLGGMTLIHSATAVVVSFTAPMLANNFGQTYKDLLWLLLFLQFLSMPATFVCAMLSDTWSKHRPIMIVLSGWGIVLLLLTFSTGFWMPWTIVTVLACCLGATNAAMRGFLAEAVHPGQSAAFFGISTFSARIFSALGPLLFAAVSKLAGERMAMLTIMLVLAGGATLLLVHFRQGGRLAAPSAP